jgi:hypothetical protein
LSKERKEESRSQICIGYPSEGRHWLNCKDRMPKKEEEEKKKKKKIRSL